MIELYYIEALTSNKEVFKMGREIVAMILAGGRGTRLEALTAKVAKPAVHFGGKYRIIDFPLVIVLIQGLILLEY